MTAGRAFALAALIGASFAHCGPGATADASSRSAIGEHPTLEERAASTALPATFGLGRTAGPDEISALDIDVRPDGAGLPPGSGTVAQGAALYAARCAVCHGVSGEGGLNDRLVGTEPLGPDGGPRTIGNYWPYAPTLFDYVRRAMPFDTPGVLEDEQVYGLVAFLLHANGIVSEDAVMNATTLPDVVMPAADRFVTDDRLDYRVVR